MLRGANGENVLTFIPDMIERFCLQFLKVDRLMKKQKQGVPGSKMTPSMAYRASKLKNVLKTGDFPYFFTYCLTLNMLSEPNGMDLQIC